MPDHTPEAAIERLLELSPDVRAAVLAESDGRPAASTEQGSRAGEMARLAAELFERAAKLPGGVSDQLEAQVDGGGVYAVRREGRVLAAVAERPTLSSLMFYDLRAALAVLDGDPA
jgi:predicted regulator of Ras-like GTPase activity (Roadblock/LC7/MglB family)